MPRVDPNDVPEPHRAFVARLQDVGARRYHDKHPFHVAMNTGKLTREQLVFWACQRYAYQRIIPRKDGAILSSMSDPAQRRRWMQRIVDQDGRAADGSDSGLENWLRLIDSLGGDRTVALDERTTLPGVRFAVDAYLEFCLRAPWYEAVCASLTELFAPKIHAVRIEVFPQFYPWVDEPGLTYFRNRLTQAPNDVSHGLAVVLEYFGHSRAQQDRAVEIVEFKCDLLWSLLDAVQQACAPELPSQVAGTVKP